MAEPPEANTTMTLEEISLWKVNALRDYLRQRNLPNSNKTKSELAALVYGAMHLDIQPVQTAVEMEQQTKNEYKALLKGDSFQLTDPFTIKEWKEEAEGMVNWPKVQFIDLVLFTQKNDKALSSAMYSRYKQGKAFSYFHDGWIQNIFSHQDPTNNIIYFSAKCLPSERVNSPPHELWIACGGSTGEVLACYCSCTAGYVIV